MARSRRGSAQHQQRGSICALTLSARHQASAAVENLAASAAAAAGSYNNENHQAIENHGVKMAR